MEREGMAIVVGTPGYSTLLAGIDADSLGGLNGDDHLYDLLGADSVSDVLCNDPLTGSEVGALLGDTLKGGVEGVVYEIANQIDLIVESADEGTNTVNISISRTPGSNAETLTLASL